MKKTNKTTSKKITQLKGELGEMLKQFEKIKIEKQVKAKKTAITTHKTRLKKNSSFLKDDFLSDNFFKESKKTSKRDSKKEEQPIQEERKEVESNNPFIDITLDQEQPIIPENSTNTNDSISDFEIEITELTSELTALENDLSTNEIQLDNSITDLTQTTTTNITSEKELSKSQNDSYLTIKQKLEKIKSEISNNNIENKVEYTTGINAKNTPLGSKKNTPPKKEIQKELSKNKKPKIVSNNNVDKLTIAILGLVVVILVIVWLMLK